MQDKNLAESKKKTARKYTEKMVKRRMASDIEATIDGMELLTTDFLAEFLGVSKQALMQWREMNQGPAFIQLGAKTVRYPKKEVMKWLRANQTKTNLKVN